ncbi:MAG: hypothetical protein IKE17_14670 [Clostridia bacterium]|nr:hypothetical protein [Clostridia bacterium]
MNVQTLERAIRAKCLDCCGGMRNEVRDCKLQYCPLWPYRGAGGEVCFPAAVNAAADGAASGVLSGQMNINDFVGRR